MHEIDYLVMTRRIKKGDHGTPVDLISDLPRNVIDCILEHLSIRDAVRTSILSRKWRYMWTTIPRLEFDDIFFENILISGHLEDYEIPSIITEVLLLHDGPVREFILSIPHDYPIRVRCLNQWILFLSRRGIKDLELVNQQAEPYEMPSHLFSCQLLTYLELTNFTLTPPPDFVGFKSLIELHMYDIRIESATLEILISGCPLLEELTISYCLGFDYLNIYAPSLQVLIIEDARVFKSICFKKSKNLVDLTIILKRSVEDFEGTRRSNLVNFFSSLPKIEKLCLVDGYIKFLSAGSIPQTLPKMIYSLKRLELHGIAFSERVEISLLLCLLKSSPNLVELEVRIHNVEWQPVLNYFGELSCSACSLVELRTVTIEVNTVFEPAVDLVQYLLPNSPSLELLTFKIGRKQSDAHKLLRVSRDLLHIGRASPRAEINFLYEGL